MISLAVLQEGEPEIFYTLQGEGTSQGYPAIFIRLSFCNLTCKWCDTPYTWMWSDKLVHNWAKPYKPEEQIVKMNNEAIVSQLLKYPHCRRLVVTGGEPLLQDEKLASLFKLLKGYLIEVETNGTICPTHCGTYVTQFNVSPKLSNSGNSEKRRDVEGVMTFFARSWKSTFKFVIASAEDLQEVLMLIAKYEIDKDKVILMPEGVNEEQLRQRGVWLSEICKERGFRFSTRLHILLYGQKKGV